MTKLDSHFTKYLNNVKVESTAVSSIWKKNIKKKWQRAFSIAMINDISWWFPGNRKWGSHRVEDQLLEKKESKY